jgi:3',5'-cyclic AMP phosphodiesterase CpdA
VEVIVFRLLVIDDEIDTAATSDGFPRRAIYQHLEAKFEITYLQSLEELSEALQKQPHAVLLDYFLVRWSTDARTVLSLLPADLPVGLISAQWNQSFENIRSTLKEFADQIASLFTIDELSDPARRGLVVTWLDHSIRRRRDIAVTALTPEEPIRILHLSDIQFGSKLPLDVEAETEMLAEQVREVWGGVPTFIAVTGDIAQHGLPAEYSAARDWLHKLGREFDSEWSGDRFLVVPGNHDLCWGLGRACRIEPGDDKLLQPGERGLYADLQQYALRPFRDFAKELTGSRSWDDNSHAWVMASYRHLGIIFCGINTCEETDGNSIETRRLRDPTIAKLYSEVRTALRNHEGDNPLIVTLMHHPLNVTPDMKGVINPGAFMGPFAQIKGAVVTLCGHVHSNQEKYTAQGDGAVLEIIASTPTQAEALRQKDSLRGFNLVEFGREKGRVASIELVVCTFEDHSVSSSRRVRYIRDVAGGLQKAT